MARVSLFDPEDPAKWDQFGKKIANTMTLGCCLALFLGNACWQLMSPLAPRLGDLGINFTESQLFWITSIPALSGATFRCVYGFLYAFFSARLCIGISTLALLIPTCLTMFLLWDGATNGSTNFVLWIIAAISMGLGGGIFSFIMPHITYYWPLNRKATALGITGGLGNWGVSFAQVVVPAFASFMIIPGITGNWDTTGQGYYSPNSGLLLTCVLVIVTGVLVLVFVSDVPGARGQKPELQLLFSGHMWIVNLIYIVNYGCYLGISSVFGLLVKGMWPEKSVTAIAWVCPFLGAISRTAGGFLCDKYGAGLVTVYVMVGLFLFSVVMLCCMPNGRPGENWSFFIGSEDGSFVGYFVAGCIPLCMLSGIGNGSITGMCPPLFLERAKRRFLKKLGLTAVMVGDNLVHDGSVANRALAMEISPRTPALSEDDIFSQDNASVAEAGVHQAGELAAAVDEIKRPDSQWGSFRHSVADFVRSSFYVEDKPFPEIPSLTEEERELYHQEMKKGGAEGSCAVAFSGGVAAYGGFIIPQIYNMSANVTNSYHFGVYIFLVMYVVSAFGVWWTYCRKNAVLSWEHVNV